MSGNDGTRIGSAYDAVAELYTELFADELDERPRERKLLADVAIAAGRSPDRPTIDLGCGPGQVAAHLAAQGLRVIGVDISEALLAIAAARNPEIGFCRADMTQLPFPTDSAAGLVSRYSTIHIDLLSVTAAVHEMARVVAPGGAVLLSFQAADHPGDHGREYPHKVATAHLTHPETLAETMTNAGLDVVSIQTRPPDPDDERQFSQAAILATR